MPVHSIPNDWKRGVKSSCAQHGELFQGAIEDGNGRIRRCLLSLNCQSLRSVAVFVPTARASVEVTPSHKQKARRAAELSLAYFGAADRGGSLIIDSNITEGKGYGSSTADCTAAVLAVAEAAGSQLTEAEVARLVVGAEQASDNLMFNHAVLFAHREGVVLENYEKPLPRMLVVGVDTQEDRIVETLTHPRARYSTRQIESFRVLVAALRRGVRSGDLSMLGRVATSCAIINQEFLQKPFFDEIRLLSQGVGALGVSIAHSGTVISVLLDPRDPKAKLKANYLIEQFTGLGLTHSICFHT